MPKGRERWVIRFEAVISKPREAVRYRLSLTFANDLFVALGIPSVSSRSIAARTQFRILSSHRVFHEGNFAADKN